MAEPVLITEGIKAYIIGGSGGVSTGLLLKIAYDYFKASSRFMTKEDCVNNQHQCTQTVALNEEFIKHKSMVTEKLKHHDTLLDKIETNTNKTSEHVHEISRAVAVIAAKGK